MNQPTPGISIAALMPHPPVLIPGVGGSRCLDVEPTIQALKSLANTIVSHQPDLLILLSPHSPRPSSHFSLWLQPRLRGGFEQFGDTETEIDLPNDLSYAKALLQEANPIFHELMETKLDHGATVPLYFMQEAGWVGATVVIGLTDRPPAELDHLGRQLQHLCLKEERRCALIASGDMSHRLKPGAPCGYDPAAQSFDQQFVTAIQEQRLATIATIDPALRLLAAEDVVDSTLVALGALREADRNSHCLSYEGPFGVGYTVAILGESTSS